MLIINVISILRKMIISEYISLVLRSVQLTVTMFGVASSLRQAKSKAPLCVMREHYF